MDTLKDHQNVGSQYINFKNFEEKCNTIFLKKLRSPLKIPLASCQQKKKVVMYYTLPFQ